MKQSKNNPKSHSTVYLLLEAMARPSKKFRINQQILVVAYVFAFLFLALIGYIAYYVAIPGKEDVTSSYNPRKDLYESKIIKGDIITSDGVTVAKSLKGKKDVRSYPYQNMYAHVVGYNSYGKAGLEASANYYLYDSDINLVDKVINTLKDEKSLGNNLYTTLDSKLQKTAYNALGSYDGAVVVMEPKTGKILAMVSKPDYDPNYISTFWEQLSKDEDSALLNRATQGLYPPGSTFKIVTALEYMREKKKWNRFSYDCSGTTVVDSVSIKCAGHTAHGTETIYDAMAHSCNCAFVTMASGLNGGKFKKTAEQLLFNNDLPLLLEYSKSRFVLNGKSDKSEMPQTSIGQGDTLMTPMLNCMLISAVANDGVMMKPYLTDYVESADGKVVKEFLPETYAEVMTKEEADALEKMLVSVVEEGTASYLSGLRHTYAGKTGSAEHAESDVAHAWFVGYSPVEKPEIAVCVLAEDGGSGSKTAVPIARQIFQTYYDNKK